MEGECCLLFSRGFKAKRLLLFLSALTENGGIDVIISTSQMCPDMFADVRTVTVKFSMLATKEQKEPMVLLVY